MSLGYAELARVGMDELARMATAGELTLAHRWVALKGAAKYTAAMARGDVANPSDAGHRVGVCAACKHRQDRDTQIGVAHYCGRPFEETSEGTCGCLVGVTIDGVTLAAGRTMVASKTCSLDEPRWLAVPRGRVE